MFCKECGNELGVDSKFCNKCGKSVTDCIADRGTTYSYEGKIYQEIDIYYIAKYERTLEISFLLYILGMIGGFMFPAAFLLCLIAFCYMIYSFAMLKKAQGGDFFIILLFVLLLFIPGINLIIFVITLRNAHKILKNAGLHLGFLGVSKNDIKKLRQSIDAKNVVVNENKDVKDKILLSLVFFLLIPITMLLAIAMVDDESDETMTEKNSIEIMQNEQAQAREEYDRINIELADRTQKLAEVLNTYDSVKALTGFVEIAEIINNPTEQTIRDCDELNQKIRNLDLIIEQERAALVQLNARKEELRIRYNF